MTWQMEPGTRDERRSVAITWRERGGPMVKAPERRGFGLRLLERGLDPRAGRTAQLDFAPQGFDCRLWLPLPAAPGKP
ncbi:sensor histidine kinase [Dankookia rubra]|uniref:Sensor histidine kinase n=1 Tax=Dankookia rubra TaxID=1442381 RepID=A0A4V3A9D9_9PROT|nr:sensor histidine kinase [Dankookia rubra]TDH58875.1 sensor histidine kinase [Dankookia rubra]